MEEKKDNILHANVPLTKEGKRQFAKLRAIFKKLGGYKELDFTVDYRPIGINGAFGTFTFHNGNPTRRYISITASALNRMTLGGLTALMAHELGHYVNHDDGWKYTVVDFLRWIGLTYFGNTFQRYKEYRADAYAFKLTGYRVLEYLTFFQGERIRGNFSEYLNGILPVFGFKNLSTHPSVHQRISFLKRKYKGLMPLLTVLNPFYRLPSFDKMIIARRLKIGR